MERAYNFSKDNRALGMGALGWHSLLQSKMLPFDSQEAYNLNSEVFKLIQKRSNVASKHLAEKFGEPELLKGYGRRNTTLNAIAPTTSSAFILGQVSQGIEPIWSNIYVKDIAKIKTTIKNPFLVKLLEDKGMNTPEVWKEIRDMDGSVQGLDFLSENEKEVFKTYPEIDQLSIIYQAANRQNYIDQGQSLNIIIHPDTPTKEVNKIHVTAWKLGLKSLYYQHSMNAAQKFKQKKECESCEGQFVSSLSIYITSPISMIKYLILSLCLIVLGINVFYYDFNYALLSAENRISLIGMLATSCAALLIIIFILSEKVGKINKD